MSLKRNTLWNLAGTGAPLVLGAITIPYLMDRIGVEAFGLLTLVWVLIGYFSLFDFGLGRALTQQLANCRSAGQTEELPGLMKTGLILTAVTGAMGGLILASIALPLGFHWLNVSASLQTSAVHSMFLASIGIPLATLTNGFRGVLEAYEEFRAVNISRIILGASNFGLPAISVAFFGPSLSMMVASLVGARVIVLLLHIYFANKLIPIFWISAKIKRKDSKTLYSFGIWMTVSNIISPLIVNSDRFFISAVLGASVVAYYSVPFEILIRVLIIPGALTSALFPRLAFLFANNAKAANDLYLKCMKYVTAAILPIILLIIFGSHWGLSLWLGEEFSNKSWMITTILALGILFNSIAQVPFAAIQAIGNARLTARIHIAEAIIYFPVLYLALRYYGLLGAATVSALRCLSDLLALMFGLKLVQSKN